MRKCTRLLACVIGFRQVQGKSLWELVSVRRTISYKSEVFFVYYFGGLECVGHSFAYVAQFVFLRDVWIRTQTAAVTSRRATRYQLSHPSPFNLKILVGCLVDLFAQFRTVEMGMISSVITKGSTRCSRLFGWFYAQPSPIYFSFECWRFRY